MAAKKAFSAHSKPDVLRQIIHPADDHTVTDRKFCATLNFLVCESYMLTSQASPLQVILLGRRRDSSLSEEERQMWVGPLLRSIKAISSNMRNTG